MLKDHHEWLFDLVHDVLDVLGKAMPLLSLYYLDLGSVRVVLLEVLLVLLVVLDGLARYDATFVLVFVFSYLVSITDNDDFNVFE